MIGTEIPNDNPLAWVILIVVMWVVLRVLERRSITLRLENEDREAEIDRAIRRHPAAAPWQCRHVDETAHDGR